MATPLIGTVIITGGNGALGSEIAVAIAKTQPLVHLLLAARNVKDESVQQVADKIRMIGPRSLEIAKLDLADFNSVTTFARFTVERVQRKTIPPIMVLINSAATLSYSCDEFTKDGYDPVYQVNCLSPFLLTVSLLEGFRASGSLVLNIGCSTISDGRLDYFETYGARGEKSRSGSALSAKEGNIRFGSSKLLMSAVMYALRRSLHQTANISLNICTLDPGGMAGESRLSTDMPKSMRVTQKTRESLRPLVRIFSKSAINTTSVPAKAIARIAFQKNRFGDSEPYYILDDVYEASSVIEVLRDGEKMNSLLRKIMVQVGLAMEGSPSPV